MACVNVTAPTGVRASVLTPVLGTRNFARRLCLGTFHLQQRKCVTLLRVAAVSSSGWSSEGKDWGAQLPSENNGRTSEPKDIKWISQKRNMWFPVDVAENEQHYTFVADVPGVSKEDIKVQVSKDRELSISGGREHPNLQEIVRLQENARNGLKSPSQSVADFNKSNLRLRQERRFGKFKRSWNLPEDADVSQIYATVQQGVLSVVIQKKQPAEPELTDVPVS